MKDKKYQIGFASIVGGRIDTLIVDWSFNDKGAVFNFLHPNKKLNPGEVAPVPMLFNNFEALMMFKNFGFIPVEISETKYEPKLKIES